MNALPKGQVSMIFVLQLRMLLLLLCLLLLLLPLLLLLLKIWLLSILQPLTLLLPPPPLLLLPLPLLPLLLFLILSTEIDGCADNPCVNVASSTGTCFDVPAPGVGFKCKCPDELVWDGTACSACVSVVAGTGEWGSSGDQGPATSARLFGPYDVSVDASGNILIAGESTQWAAAQPVSWVRLDPSAHCRSFKYGIQASCCGAAHGMSDCCKPPQSLWSVYDMS
jgi:hypothetical protein